MQARAICSLLRQRLDEGAMDGEVLSAFEHAVNIDTPAGLVSVLARARCLQPFGLVVGNVDSFGGDGIAPGTRVRLTEREIRFMGATIALQGAAGTELSVCGALLPLTGPSAAGHPQTNRPSLRLAPLLAVLASGRGEDGLSALVTRCKSNVYADFLEPRLPRLFAAVAAGDAAEAGEAAARIAGCGVGLTPSSDDLLTGYMAMLHALSAAGVLGDVASITRSIADRAAKKTNRISGAFLLQSGAGYVSEDVLRLLQLLCSDTDAQRVESAAARVAAFGSTSGSDMLTGIVLAIIHHDGGKNSGQTGNQEKRLF